MTVRNNYGHPASEVARRIREMGQRARNGEPTIPVTVTTKTAVTEGPTRTCIACRTTKLVSDYALDKTARDGLSVECRKCRTRRKARGDLGHREVQEAPDRRVAVRLRTQLEAGRQIGLDFDEAWARAVTVATDGLREGEGWRAALTATRAVWRAAYVAEDPQKRFALTPCLLD
jgi:hypothetical protein